MNKLITLAAAVAATLAMSAPATAARSESPVRIKTITHCTTAAPSLGHNVVNVVINNERPRRIPVRIKMTDPSTGTVIEKFTDHIAAKGEIATVDQIELYLRAYYDYGVHIVVKRGLKSHGRTLFNEYFFDEGCTPSAPENS